MHQRIVGAYDTEFKELKGCSERGNCYVISRVCNKRLFYLQLKINQFKIRVNVVSVLSGQLHVVQRLKRDFRNAQRVYGRSDETHR